MAECAITDLNCQAGSVAQNAVSSALDSMARDAGKAAAEVIGRSFTFWVETESVNPDSEAVRNFQQYTLPIAAVVLVGSVLVQSMRMILSRKGDPAINVGLGLIRYAVVTSVGLGVLALAMRAGDDLSSWLVDQAVGDFSLRMQQLLGGGGALGDSASVVGTVFPGSVLLLIFGFVGVILGLVQWILAFFRQAGVLVLAVMLPLAASGSINDSTKVWMNRLMPWLITLVAYKPMAALIYTIGFSFMSDGEDFETVITGMMVMALAALAMPAMLRFFSWTQFAATGGSGVAGALAAGATGAASMAALRSARGMELTGPGSVASSPGGSATPGAPSGSPGGLGPGSGSGSPAGNSRDRDKDITVGATGQPSGAGEAPGSAASPARAGGGGPPSAAGTGAGAPAAGSGGAAAGGAAPGAAAAAGGSGAAAGGAAGGGAAAGGAAAGGAAAAGAAGVAGGAAAANATRHATEATSNEFIDGGGQQE
jgi:type IV secretion system protein TrbL